MASEYLKWKYRDVKPEERAELTPAEKRKNWWHYHKWHVAVAVVLLGVGVNLIGSALGFGQIRPDYQVAYVGENALPDDTAAAIERIFASMGMDLNGDGQVTVRLNQYPIGGADPGLAESGHVTLTADLLECESYFFLLEDPVWFQANYQALCRLDGSLPEGASTDGTYLAWIDCPVLAGIKLGGYSYQLLGETISGSSDELMSGLYLARRGFWTEKTTPYPEGCEALWNSLTEGSLS